MAEVASIILNGIAIGTGFFLVSAGLTILFGILRILNFAHGSFVMLGAYFASIVLSHFGDYGPATFMMAALAAGLAVGCLGLVADFVVFRRLQEVDQAVALIATFAVMLIANGVAELIWGSAFLSVDPPQGLEGVIALGPVLLPAFSAFLIAVGALIFVLLELVLHRSWAGKTLQAIAEDRVIMGIMGHSPRRIELGAVFLAFVLAGFAGGVLAPNQILAPSLGNQLIIQAFSVVVVGGLGSVRGAFLAAMLLGLAESLGSRVMPSLALYICMIIILILRPQGMVAPAFAATPGSWSFAWLWEVWRRPITGPGGKRQLSPVATSTTHAVPAAVMPRGITARQVAMLCVLGLLIISVPFWAGGGLLFIASLVLIGSIFALSWNLMFGFGGIATFGHAAFFAVGAYLSAYLLKSAPAFPFVLVLGGALVLGALLAAVIGAITVRRATGVQFAILTLALAEVLRVLISYSTGLGRDEGLSAIPRPSLGFGIQLASDSSYYLFLCAICFLVTWALWMLSHSPFGRTLRGVRQDAERARFLGINVDWYRLRSFIVAGAVAALAGALASPLTQIATPEVASIARSTQPMLHTLVGGAGTFWGPVVGTAVFAAIDYSTRTLAGLSELLMGTMLLVIILVAPGGVVGYVRRVQAALAGVVRRAP